jgi:hypothetical protein
MAGNRFKGVSTSFFFLLKLIVFVIPTPARKNTHKHGAINNNN